MIWWNFIKKREIKDWQFLDCEATSCVTFRTDYAYYCGGFYFTPGFVSTVQSDEGDDLVWGYYCSGTTKEVTTGDLDKIVGSIVIRD